MTLDNPINQGSNQTSSTGNTLQWYLLAPKSLSLNDEKRETIVKQLHWINSDYISEENYLQEYKTGKSGAVKNSNTNQQINLLEIKYEEVKEENKKLLLQYNDLKKDNENSIPKKKYDILMNLYNEEKEKSGKGTKGDKHTNTKLNENNMSFNINEMKRPGLLSEKSSDRQNTNPNKEEVLEKEFNILDNKEYTEEIEVIKHNYSFLIIIF